MNATHFQAVVDWLGQAEFLSQFQASTGRPFQLVSIVMSHRGRAMELDSAIRASIDRLLEQFRRDDLTLLASDETPMGSYLLNAARRFGLRLMELASPPTARTDPDGMPWVDRALVALPEKVYVVEVRPESKTIALLMRRLKDPRFPQASVYVEVGPMVAGQVTSRVGQQKTNLRRSVATETLLQHGSVAHIYSPVPWDETESEDVSARHDRSSTSRVLFDNFNTSVVPILRRLKDYDKIGSEWPYLTHCTRACFGPWPDQSVEGYFDDLLVGGNTSAQAGSPLATLRRILEQQRLIATKHLKRSEDTTVSFSQVPMPELLSRRCFRSHLGRWDWEPYGICIKRNQLESLGARPVIYRPIDAWESLPDEDRPFFQPNESSWEAELEWRIVDDLHLAAIPFEAGLVFVPTMEEAIELSKVSRFPILCLDGLLVS